MATSPYTDTLQTTNLKNALPSSQQWLREQMITFNNSSSPSELLKPPPNKIESRLVSKITVGRMYLFKYDPKTKEDLPYYDIFPLIFPFRRVDDGFFGINFHYLPYILRARLMDSLYTLANNNKNDDTTKLKLSYQLLNASSRYKYFEPCVKHYLNSQVRSRFLWIPADQWKTALFLPFERFVKKNKSVIFQRSRRSVR